MRERCRIQNHASRINVLEEEEDRERTPSRREREMENDEER